MGRSKGSAVLGAWGWGMGLFFFSFHLGEGGVCYETGGVNPSAVDLGEQYV